MKDYDKLITRKHLASILTCSEQTIARYEKRGLPVIHIGVSDKLPRYNFEAVMSWVHKMESTTT